MCQTCGCVVTGEVAIDGVAVIAETTHPHHHPIGSDHNHDSTHAHAHDHPHADHFHDDHCHHDHSHADHCHPNHASTGTVVNTAITDPPVTTIQPRTLTIAQGILSKNDRLAERNRGYFQAKGLLVLNVVSSPGSGKTALLERLLQDWPQQGEHQRGVGVIVGDLETDNDAQRLRTAGDAIVQITTGTACHLEADMIAQAAQKLDLDRLDLLVIENVGNLVCPAAYDLGEDLRIVLLSVTEGEDKPLKYAPMFKTADAIVINKIDLADAVGFDRERAIANLQKIAPQVPIFEVSARTGAGLAAWYQYVQGQHECKTAMMGS
ncbi:hydrogenase nickel incorporation protein HypB [Trichothermofontia sp.]